MNLADRWRWRRPSDNSHINSTGRNLEKIVRKREWRELRVRSTSMFQVVLWYNSFLETTRIPASPTALQAMQQAQQHTSKESEFESAVAYNSVHERHSSVEHYPSINSKPICDDEILPSTPNDSKPQEIAASHSGTIKRALIGTEGLCTDFSKKRRLKNYARLASDDLAITKSVLHDTKKYENEKEV